MIRLIRAEWIKLRTITMNWVLTILAFVFPLAITLLNAWFRGNKPDFDTRALIDVLDGTSYVTVLLLSVVAAVAITNEYGFGTIRPTFVAVPRRSRVIAAKAIVLVIYALVLQTIVVVIGFGVGSALANHRGSSIHLSDQPAGFNALVGSIILAGLASLLGLGVGMLLRSTPVSVTLLILYPLLVESLIGGLISVITKNTKVLLWLPYRAGFQLSSLDIGARFDGGPGRVTSGIYFGAVSIGLLVLGALSVQRRDA